MPALLFILPMELGAVIVAAFLKFGTNGVAYLVKFDEEKALKTG